MSITTAMTSVPKPASGLIEAFRKAPTSVISDNLSRLAGAVGLRPFHRGAKLVGVAFTVGPSGRGISQSVTRSSGNAALDSAAHAILSAIHTPPPPGGRFSTSTNLRFNFH